MLSRLEILSRDGEGRPCSEIDGSSTHYNRRHIRIDTYAFDLGAENLEEEEKVFAGCLIGLVRPEEGVENGAWVK